MPKIEDTRPGSMERVKAMLEELKFPIIVFGLCVVVFLIGHFL